MRNLTQVYVLLVHTLYASIYSHIVTVCVCLCSYRTNLKAFLLLLSETKKIIFFRVVCLLDTTLIKYTIYSYALRSKDI